MKKHRFNIFPPMASEDYARLKTDLSDYGYDKKQPIWIYEGNILDGYNRYTACQELGIEPVFADFSGSESEALDFVMRTNKRRNLTSSQWAVIAIEAEDIVKAIKAEARERQGRRNDLTSVNKFTEVNPERSAQKIAEVFNTNQHYISDIQKLNRERPEYIEQIKSGEKSIPEVKKEIRKVEQIERRAELAEIGKNKKLEVDFRLGDFVEVFSDIPDGSIDCIITDPPYPKEYLSEWSKLAKFAKRVLKPNGYCIAYSGQMHLPEVLNRMSEYLDYYWTFAVYHEGQTQIVNGVNLICRWKPVLIYQNGKKKIENTFQDYFISEQREKEGHEWQQSQSGVSYLIEMFTNEYETIIDPFAGSGTTIRAGMAKNRKVIAAEIDEEAYNTAKALL